MDFMEDYSIQVAEIPVVFALRRPNVCPLLGRRSARKSPCRSLNKEIFTIVAMETRRSQSFEEAIPGCREALFDPRISLI